MFKVKTKKPERRHWRLRLNYLNSFQTNAPIYFSAFQYSAANAVKH